MNRDFGMEIGYQLCYRAKNKAIKKAQGTIEHQYNLLEAYAHCFSHDPQRAEPR